MTRNPDNSPLPGGRSRKAGVRRAIRIVGFVLLCLITLFFLAIAVENWRGKRAWESYKAELKAKGERLDFEAFAPKPVPPEQNFCATPSLTPESNEQSGTGQGQKGTPSETRSSLHINLTMGSGETDRPPTPGSFELGTLEDWKGWREFYQGNTNYPQAPASLSAAEAVLVNLSKYDAVIADLKQANRRPYAVLPLDYSDPTQLPAELLPLLARYRRVTRLFCLHAAALIQAGRPDEALKDLEVCFRIEEALRSDPLLISQLVSIAMVHIMVQPVWEGLAKQRWDEPQLAELQDRFATIDFLTSYETAMRGERAFGNAMLEIYRNSKRELPFENEANGPEDPAMRFLKLAPNGWLYQNQVTGNQLFQDFVFPIVSPAKHRIYLDRQRALERWPEQRGGGLYTVLARMSCPAISKVSTRFALSQVTVDLEMVACALERYRLAEGAYPANLEELTPRFLEKLPPDVINGQPLHYRRDENRGFVLYSVGLNEVDNGGSIGRRKSGTVDYEQGDWVWRYPQDKTR